MKLDNTRSSNILLILKTLTLHEAITFFGQHQLVKKEDQVADPG